ncbi:MAG: L-threonylcarbamoyladenylate synthase [Candidatus Bathyarchaeia archaeon]
MIIIKLEDNDFDEVLQVINDAAVAYKGVIPFDCWREPYMPAEELREEIESGVQFYGLKEEGVLVAVMGIQPVRDVTLIRHAYVLSSQQRKGHGEKLIKFLMGLAETPTVLVGTWKAAYWAVNFYAKNNFTEVSEEEKNRLLYTYWKISERQIETSTVLKIEKQDSKTIFFQVDPVNPDPKKIQTAAEIIQKGGLVAFPTETVYGLGANALNANAVLALFKAKNRPLDNPPILHIADPAQVYQLAKEVPKNADALMKRFWPGPLTLIFKRSEKVPRETVAGLDTVAVRMPKHNVALALIKQSGVPIAAPSANLSGKPSPTTAQHVYGDLNGRINAILDGGSTSIGVESTVLDLSVAPPVLLRPGGTPFEAIQKLLPNVVLHPFVASEKEVALGQARSPGMMHKHYAPNAEVLLVEGTVQAVVKKIKLLSEQYKLEGKRVGVLATDETKKEYVADVVKSMGSRFNLDTIANGLFRELREFDQENVDVILAEGVPLEGIGLAVMNRLRKASGYHIIKA